MSMALALTPTPSSEGPAGRWQAVLDRDAGQDGTFYYGVLTTGIFCRPSCASRKPHRDNVVFFEQAEEARQLGFRPCLRCRPLSRSGSRQVEMVKRVCRLIEQNLEESLTLAQLAAHAGQSPFHLQRTFKQVLGVSPREYKDACRMNRFRRGLQAGKSVTVAMHDAGFGSTSRLYERAMSQMGMLPDRYRRGAIGVSIRYATADSPLGRMLVAATDKGICAVRFGRDDEELEVGLRREYPFAQRQRDDHKLRGYVDTLLAQLRGRTPDSELPLDISATAFQRRVWAELQAIPHGETRSYAEVAKRVGKPHATRAVARACATNPCAVAIPCHRVVASDGSLSGYRWGTERKQKLLQLEGVQVSR